MKKIISVVLAVIMLASLAVLPASAKNDTPFGTVVEATYTETAPNMKDGVLDDSWGEKVIHVDKKTPNAAITNYSF